MSKDPAFLFYSQDFLTGVSDLTMEERGQYITLLAIQHQKGRLSRKAVALAVGNTTADVMAKFEEDENGLFFNKRLEDEAFKRKEYSDKQRQRALDGWKKRKAEADAAALPLEDVNEDVVTNKERYQHLKNLVQTDSSERFLNAMKFIGVSIHQAKYLFIDLFKNNLKDEPYESDEALWKHFQNWGTIKRDRLSEDQRKQARLKYQGR